MVNQSKTPTLDDKHLTYPEMETAVIKIDRQLEELKKINIEEIQSFNDNLIRVLEHKLEELLGEIFGRGSIQYENYKYITDFSPSYYDNNEKNIQDIRDYIKNCVSKAMAVLGSIKQNFMEKIQDAQIDKPKRIISAYQHLELHPDIANAASKLYLDGYYSNAIEDAVKALNELVRIRSGIIAKDGVSLMQEVFSQKSPVLKFNQLNDDSDRDEQKGFMDLFTGAVAGLRNPRAHKIIQDDPERTLEFIAFISLLAKLVDNAKK